MTGTSGAIASAIVSRVAGLPLVAAVDLTDSRTRTRRDGKSTHTISPTIVFEATATPAVPAEAAFAVAEEGAVPGLTASSGATRSARRRTSTDITRCTCTSRAGFGGRHRAAGRVESAFVQTFRGDMGRLFGRQPPRIAPFGRRRRPNGMVG